MAVPQNKQELISAINLNIEKLLKELNSIPADLAEEKTMDGHVKGTQMSVCNLVAYLLGWNRLVLKWLEKDAARQVIDFPESGFKWNELGKLAQKFYSDYEGLEFSSLLKKLTDAKKKIVQIIENKNNHELYEQAWHAQWSMGRMIQFNTSSPYSNARIRLRKWLKMQHQAQ